MRRKTVRRRPKPPLSYYVRTISTKGQFAIPKAVCQQLGVGPGDKVTLSFTPDRFLAVAAAFPKK